MVLLLLVSLRTIINEGVSEDLDQTSLFSRAMQFLLRDATHCWYLTFSTSLLSHTEYNDLGDITQIKTM